MELVWENLFKNRRFAWPTFPAMPCQNFLHAEGTACVAVTSESWYERRPKRDFTQPNLYDTAPRGSCFNFSLLVGRKFLCKFEKGVNYSFAFYFMLLFNSFNIIHPAHFFRNSHSLLGRLSTKTCYLCNTSPCFCVSNNKSSSSTLKVTTVQSCTLCVCFFVIH